MIFQKLYNLFKKRESISDLNEVFLIAEIGKNFIQTEDERPISEYLHNAKILIDEACRAGVDAVKFQTHVLEDEQAKLHIVSPHFNGSDRYLWVKRNSDATPHEFWSELKKYAEAKGLIFLSTPMSKLAAEKLINIGVNLWKVGSGDVDDILLLDRILETNKPIIISSGMVSLNELDHIMNYLLSKSDQIGLLYCVSKYPCEPESFNLATIKRFIDKYPNATVGFSDHSVDSYDVTLAAIKMGAKIIEKHFSLSRQLWGPDHKASLEPEEFKELVKLVRNQKYKDIDHEKFYGNYDLELEGANNIYRPYFKKTLVAKNDIRKGKKIELKDLSSLRPRMYLDGLSPINYTEILGKKTKKKIAKHTPLKFDMFE